VDILAPPVFSIQPGFYHEPKLLELHHDDHPDVTINYTTDGSVPDTSSIRYEGPIGLAPHSSDSNHVSMIRTTLPRVRRADTAGLHLKCGWTRVMSSAPWRWSS